MTSTAVVVLGMHRAGTSVTARMLELAGVYLGKDLFPPQPGVNDKGFWENRHIVRFNDDLLLAVGSSWDDWLTLRDDWFGADSYQWFPRHLKRLLHKQFQGKPLWGVKDPRTCRLLPLWQAVLASVADRVVYVLPLRDPDEVAASLARRDDFLERKGYVLWLRHVLEAERHTRESPRLICSFEDTLARPEVLYDGLKGLIGGCELVPRKRYLQGAKQFIDTSLRHHREGGAEPSDDAACLARRVYECLTDDENLTQRDDQLDAYFAAFSEFESQADPMLIAHIRSIARQRGAYQLIWRRLRRLYSWRLAGPLRWLERRLRDIPTNERA